MARVIWSDSAIDDLRAIGQFYERSSPTFARTIVTDLYEAVARLTTFPLSGAIVPELEDQAVRQLIVRGFRILYEAGRDQVRILAVFHGRQDLGRKLDDD